MEVLEREEALSELSKQLFIAGSSSCRCASAAKKRMRRGGKRGAKRKEREAQYIGCYILACIATKLKN